MAETSGSNRSHSHPEAARFPAPQRVLSALGGARGAILERAPVDAAEMAGRGIAALIPALFGALAAIVTSAYAYARPTWEAATAGAEGSIQTDSMKRTWSGSRFTALGLTVSMVLTVAFMAAGCASSAGKGQGCASRIEALPASRASSLIAIVPRTSANAASWGLRELAFLLPLVARAGLELHVVYTQDGDDLAEDGGDGGPPQVLEAQAPSFPVFQVQGAPQSPADPNALTAKLYCERLVAWQFSASEALRNQASRRIAAVTTWVNSAAARLTALAAAPIPDTTGREADVEFDAGASIFSAAQIAQAAPRPTIVVLGGLTAVAPPSQDFEVPAHLVVLVRSNDPAQVLHAESVWSRWIKQAGGTFQAISVNDAPSVIAGALMSLSA